MNQKINIGCVRKHKNDPLAAQRDILGIFVYQISVSLRRGIKKMKKTLEKERNGCCNVGVCSQPSGACAPQGGLQTEYRVGLQMCF